MKTGRRVWQCELSMIDTTILIAGALTSGMYFSAAADDEREIREACRIPLRADRLALGRYTTAPVCMGWKAGVGFLQLRLGGIQRGDAALCPGPGLAHSSAARRRATVHGPRTISGRTSTVSISSLRRHCSSISSRTSGLTFAVSRTSSCERSGPTTSRTAAARPPFNSSMRSAIPGGSEGTGRTAGASPPAPGPGFSRQRADGGIERQFYGYVARGVPFGPDDGTLAPWATVASLPFAPEIVLRSAPALPERLSGGDQRERPAHQLQSHLRHRRRAAPGLALSGALRARPGTGGPDDRELPLGTPLAPDARMSRDRYRAPPRGISQWMAEIDPTMNDSDRIEP